MNRRVSVRAIVLHEGKLLSVRLKSGAAIESPMKLWWCLPGGGLDEGESLVAGLKREMLEETGIMPVVGNLLYVQQFADDKREYLEFFFHVVNTEDYLQVDLSKTTHGLAEIEEIDFIDVATTNILPGFLATEPLQEAVANNLPTQCISRL
jgi:ADP-ribose pyrophosphatase YjhB (NUDIX family)